MSGDSDRAISRVEGANPGRERLREKGKASVWEESSASSEKPELALPMAKSEEASLASSRSGGNDPSIARCRADGTRFEHVKPRTEGSSPNSTTSSADRLASDLATPRRGVVASRQASERADTKLPGFERSSTGKQASDRTKD